MKTKFYTVSIYIAFIFLAASCSKEVVEPEIQFSANATTVSVNDTVTFSVEGEAAGFSIYTGDVGHEYEKSYLVVTKDKDIQTETIFLTEEKFQELKTSAVVSDPAIIDSIESMVGVIYKGASHPRFLITLFYDYEVAAAKIDEIIAFFTLENADQTPEGGYSTGVTVDASAKSKTYQYIYTTPGVYKATLVGSNVGRKKFNNDNTGLPSGKDYDIKYTIKTITITVQ